MNNNILDRIISDIEKKNYGSAISECSELIKQYPDNIKLYEIRSVCYNATGNYESAIEDLSVIIPKLEGTNDDEYLLNLYIRRGKNYIKKKEWTSAVYDFIKAIKINDSIPEVHNNLAACCRRINHFEDALIHASKAIELNNNFPEAFNNRANINICLEKYEDAISDYSESINLNPVNPKTYFNRGSIYYEVFNDIEKAREDFLAAVKHNPDYEQEIYKEYPEFKELLYVPESDWKDEDSFNDFLEEEKAEEYSEEEIKEEYTLDESEKTGEEDSKTEERNEIEDLIAKLDDKKPAIEDSIPEEIPKDEEIVVPEFDLKSMFGNQEQTDDSQQAEEENQSEIKPILSDDVKNLHHEILSIPEFKNTEPERESEVTEIRKPSPYISTARKTEVGKKSFLKSPLFIIILIVLFTAIVLLAVFKIKYTDESSPSATNTKQEEVMQGDKKEAKEEQTNEPKEERKEDSTQEVKEETKIEEKKEPVLNSRNMGFIGSKQLFVLFSEQDGYYVQIGSYKEKSKAEEKLKLLKRNKINGAIFEADLKEKGIFYRVRAGAFKSEEEAKQITLKLE